MLDPEGADRDGQVGSKAVQLHSHLKSKQAPWLLITLSFVRRAKTPANHSRTVDEQNCPVSPICHAFLVHGQQWTLPQDKLCPRSACSASLPGT